MRLLIVAMALSAVFSSESASAKSASAMSHAGQPPAMMGSEPKPGTLSFGQIVYVDDHTCPTGQIKQITGGNPQKGIPRGKECVTH